MPNAYSRAERPEKRTAHNMTFIIPGKIAKELGAVWELGLKIGPELGAENENFWPRSEPAPKKAAP